MKSRNGDSSGGYVQKPAFGSRSYTAWETASITKVDMYILKKQLSGQKLVNRTSAAMRYYIVEDGTIFKYDIEELSFYRLDLKDFVWKYDMTLLSIFYDTYLKFQMIPSFVDYFEDA